MDALKALGAWLLANPGSVIGLLSFVLGLFGAKKLLADKRAAAVEKYAHMAFHVVEELAAGNPDLVKGVEYLDQLDSLLEAAGQSALSDSEKVGAVAMAKAINNKLGQASPPPAQP